MNFFEHSSMLKHEKNFAPFRGLRFYFFFLLSPLLLLCCIILTLSQFQKAIRLEYSLSLTTIGEMEYLSLVLPKIQEKEEQIKTTSTIRNVHDNNNKDNKNIHALHTLPPPLPQLLHKNDTFGACLLVKDDNDLLPEWLAYHYTILPLRYVLIASDIGSQTVPDEILERWKTANTGLEYWSISAWNFTSTTPNINDKDESSDSSRSTATTTNTTTTTTTKTTTNDHHHALLARQREFITYCVKFMKQEGLHWISLIDTDEYVVLNPLGNNESLSIQPSDDPQAVDPIYYQLRTHPSLLHANNNSKSNKTVLDIIRDVQPIQDLRPCLTMPRVLHGALTNFSCSNAKQDIELARQISFQDDSQHNHDHALNTIQFHQHAKKGDFAASKFGKVFLDVSQLSDDMILSKMPKSPHRPYKPECKPGVVHFPEAMFYINHYLGSWERYNSRNDGRRNREEWEKRAFLTAQTSCDKHVTKWLPKFVNLVGLKRAQYLLGKSGKKTEFSNHNMTAIN